MKTALGAVLLTSALLLSACAPSGQASAPTEPAVSSGSPTPEATETSAPPADGIPAAMRADIVDAMNSGNTAALDGYLAPTVHITYAASENEGDVTDHALIIQNLSNATGDGVTWDFDLPDELVQKYRDSPGSGGAYIDDFPEGALVGRSSTKYVLSFVVSGGSITRILFAVDEYALTYE